MSNFSCDSVNNSTNIIGGSWFENSSIEKNLNIGNQLNVTNILTRKMLSNTNDLSCIRINMNAQTFTEIIGFLYEILLVYHYKNQI